TLTRKAWRDIGGLYVWVSFARLEDIKNDDQLVYNLGTGKNRASIRVLNLFKNTETRYISAPASSKPGEPLLLLVGYQPGVAQPVARFQATASAEVPQPAGSNPAK